MIVFILINYIKASFVSGNLRATIPPRNRITQVVNIGIARLVYIKCPKHREPKIPAIRQTALKNPYAEVL